MQRNGKAPKITTVLSENPTIVQQVVAATQPAAAPIPAAAPQAAKRRAGGYQSDASIARRLLDARKLLDRVLADPELQGKLSLRGYGVERILEGKQLRDQVEALTQRQRARSGEQRAASVARDAAQTRAHATYMRQVTLARVALRDDPGAAEMIGVNGRRKREAAGWIMQAQQFYANTIGEPAILAKLAIYGLTREQLAQGRDMVGIVGASMVSHEQRLETKQATTRARDAALRALDRWMRDFTTVARVALDE